MSRRRASLAAVGASAVVASLVLHAVGSRVSGPPTGSWAAVDRWYESSGAAGALAGVGRWVGLVLAGWVFTASTFQLLGSVRGMRPLQPVADRISPRSLQRLGLGLAGLSLTAGLAAPAPGAGSPHLLPQTAGPGQEVEPDVPGHEAPGTATMRRVEPAPSAPGSDPVVAADDTGASSAQPASPPSPPPTIPPSTTVPPAVPSDAAASRPYGGAEAPPAIEPPAPEAGTPLPDVVPSGAGVVSASEGSVVVRPGDSLWSIAEEALMDLTGQTEDDDVDRYWRRVVEANRSTLMDPRNPDLIFAGQVITLPAP